MMCWLYEQVSGRMVSQDGEIIASGYSGAGNGRNNPTEENIQEVGPIPEGFYDMLEPIDSGKLGPYAIPLIPDAENNMLGRSNFYIHGDNATHTASEGCIILARFARERLWQSGDHRLQVVKEIPAVT